LTPDIVSRLVDNGHKVVVSAGAGSEAGYPDSDYQAAGAEIVSDNEAWSAEMIAAIHLPDSVDLSPGSALIGLLQPFDHPERMAELAKTGVTAFAFEAVPRTTRAQTMDALSSQATVAGYQAALEAAVACDRFFPMLTTAAGTIPPSKVVILGAGVAGLQAIATARRLGAVVSAFDVRAAAAEQVRSLGATFIEVDTEPQDAETSGGYAKEVAEDEQALILKGLTPHIEKADAVISTAAIPGRRAPLLISADMVRSMRPGAVIVDLAASTGGNCELTEPGKTIDVNGVTIIGDTDLPSRTAQHASQMYAKNVVNFIELLTAESGELDPDWDDEIVAQACISRDGKLVHPRLTD